LRIQKKIKRQKQRVKKKIKNKTPVVAEASNEELNQRWLNYKNLIEALPIGIFIHVNGKIIFGNKEAYKIAELNKKEKLVNFTLLDFLSPEDRPQGIERIKKAMSGKDTPFIEYQITTRKGTKKIIRTKSSPIIYNATNAVQIIIQDITREKKLEEERIKVKSTWEINKGLQSEITLRQQSEEKLKAIFNSSSHLIWTVGKNYRISSFNDNYVRTVKAQCGINLTQNTSITDFKRLFSQEEYRRFIKKYSDAFKGKNQQFEIKFTSIDGTERFREIYLHPTRIKGKVTEVAAIAQDITDRKSAEKQVIEQSSKLNAVFESSAHLIWTINKEKEITSFNENYARAIKKLCGFTLKPGMKVTQFKGVFTDEGNKMLSKAHEEAFRGRATKIEIPLNAIDGKCYYREMQFYPILINGKINEIAAVAQDTTERRNYEKQILEQSAKLKAIFDSGNQSIWTVDRNLNLTSFNKRYAAGLIATTGRSPKINTSVIAPIKNTVYYEPWKKKYHDALKGKSLEFEQEFVMPDGKIKSSLVFLHPILNGKKEVVEIASGAQDITLRKFHEKQIIEQSSKLNAIFESGGQRMWTVNRNFEFTSFNKNFEVTHQQALGKKPKIGVSALETVKQNKEQYKFWKEKYAEALKGNNIEFETTHTDPDRKSVYGQVFFHPIYNEKKQVTEIAAISQDVTHRKTAEQKITEQAARLNTIFNSGNQLMWTVNRNIALTSFNKNYHNAIYEMYGVHPEINTDINKKKKTFASKEYHKFWDGKYEEVFVGKKSVEFDTERTTLAGKKIYRHIFLHPIFNDKKEVVEVSGIGYDITGQRVAQEQIISKQSQLAAIINTTGDIIFSVDKQCRLVEFNNVLQNVIRKRHGTEVSPGLSIFDVLPKLYHKEVKYNYKVALSGQSVLATEIFYMDGDKRVYEAHYKPILINGIVTGVAVFSKDITEQERAKQEIITKQFQLSAIINTTNDIILSLDKNLRVVEFNNVMKEIAELRSGKQIKTGDYFLDFLPKDMRSDLKKTYARALGGESIQAIENFIHPKTKQARIYSANYNPININGEIVGIAIFSRDITEQKLSEEEVLNKQSRLSAIINNTRDIILSIDRNYNLIEFNDALRSMVKRAYKIDLKPGNPVFDTLDPKHHKGMKEIYAKVFAGESIISTETFGNGPNKVIFETRYNPIKAGNNITGIAIFSSDITAQKNSEEDILKSLKEKEVLLKEIHHRVKNNLQVISSILNLQTAYLKDKHTINILKECQNRIKTMAFIHESLYQNKDFSQINFSEYIVTLVKNLFYSFEANQQKIRPNFDVEPILLNLDTSIPCGLIVNELVSNALKYAFKDSNEGAIFVELKKVGGKIKMVIGDNGRGMPDEINYKNTETLGLQLVNTLTEQINGTISMKQNKGTIFEIIF
jgi:PAS domain S-box-containing protein